jgi:hypothetical protein
MLVEVFFDETRILHYHFLLQVTLFRDLEKEDDGEEEQYLPWPSMHILPRQSRTNVP